MAVTLRLTKGTALTWQEADANFSGLANGSNWVSSVSATQSDVSVSSLMVPSGAAGFPPIAIGAASTGIYSSASNELSFSLGGTQRYVFQAGSMTIIGGTPSLVIGTVGVFAGSGAPGISATQGSLFLRTDGSTTSNRAYINTNGSTGWTPILTLA